MLRNTRDALYSYFPPARLDSRSRGSQDGPGGNILGGKWRCRLGFYALRAELDCGVCFLCNSANATKRSDGDAVIDVLRIRIVQHPMQVIQCMLRSNFLDHLEGSRIKKL